MTSTARALSCYGRPMLDPPARDEATVNAAVRADARTSARAGARGDHPRLVRGPADASGRAVSPKGSGPGAGARRAVPTNELSPAHAVPPARRGAWLTLLPCSAALLGVAAAMGAAGIGALSLGVSALAWMTLCAFVLAGLVHHPHRRFGAANAVTTLRATITVALLALVPEAGLAGGVLPADRAWWAITAAAVLSLSLDGVDGPLARRAGLASAFGARYDMEIDALLALVLSLLIWRSGELGPWVLALGTMRYAFLAAACCLPALREPLFPSMRRKSVCVVQVAALCAIVSPPIAPPLSAWIGAVAVLALLYSFGRDTLWLLHGNAAANPTPRSP